jgi:glycosyltransferase involved in cell wall biosynthesis
MEHRAQALLVRQKSAEEFATAIKELLDETELRRRLSKAAREKVCRDFDAKQNILALRALFPGSAVLPGRGSCEEIAWK